METCTGCGRSFPDGSLFTVIIDAPFDQKAQEDFLKTGQMIAFTERRLCRPCAEEAGRGMDRWESNPPDKKKWWKLWK